MIDGPSISASGYHYGVQVNEGNSLIKLRSGSLTAQGRYRAVLAANLVGADDSELSATVKETYDGEESQATITAENVSSYRYISTGTIPQTAS